MVDVKWTDFTGPRTDVGPAAAEPSYRWQLVILVAIVAGLLLAGWLLSAVLG